MKTPQDDGESVDLMTGPNPPNPSAPNKGSTSSLESFLHGLFLLLVILAFFGILERMAIRFESEVVSHQPIGRFLRMSGPGGLAGDVVIETELGSYLLHGSPAIAKGTPLILEIRATGAHFICDQARSLCVATSSKRFKANDVQPEPNASAPSPSPAQGQTP